ncbi:MAG: hypothetical protein KGZ69_14765 [Methylomonas sp.]|nr:hypothetical protein [Methylomonas sp.]
MNAPIIPVAIRAEIALEIADAQKIYQEALPGYKIKRNSWQKLNECIFNCSQANGRSSIHSGTGAFRTKCCSKNGSNLIDYFMEKDNSTIDVAIGKISEMMGCSVNELPPVIRDFFPLESTQSVQTKDGKLVQLVGNYKYGLTLTCETGDENTSEEKMLTVHRYRYESSEVINEAQFFSRLFQQSFFFEDLISNAKSNGLLKSGAVIIVNGALFIDIDKFDDWLSALAIRGIDV